MLAAAARRLRSYDGRIRLIHGTFLKIPLPRADAFVATLALHHIRTAAAKQRFYRRCHAALRPGGILASGDAFLADDPRLERAFMTAWVRHMARTYRAARARRFLRSWAGEDRYFPLGREMEMLRRAGFRVEVAWRRAPFAVLIGRKAGAG
jgi:SAM-dependent methyltransferase